MFYVKFSLALTIFTPLADAVQSNNSDCNILLQKCFKSASEDWILRKFLCKSIKIFPSTATPFSNLVPFGQYMGFNFWQIYYQIDRFLE